MPAPYQIIARVLFPVEYRRFRRFVRDNIAHAIRIPNGGIAMQVAAASNHLRIQFGK